MPQAMKLETYLKIKHLDGKSTITLNTGMSIWYLVWNI